jgi:FdhD protein
MAVRLPRLTQAQASLTSEVLALNEHGQQVPTAMPAERALTVYVDKRELVTLMTLGPHPEWLVLGFLRNQRIVPSAQALDSVTVDWSLGEGLVGEPGVAAVKTWAEAGVQPPPRAERVVTTGCGQGSVFGQLMDDIAGMALPAQQRMSQAQLYSLVGTIRLKETTYKSAGSVHACALFSLEGDEPRLLFFVEDVGRHNALDTVAGWAWMHPQQAHGPLAIYTTGRLTSEMVIKTAQMGIPLAISRSGITQMGYQVAQQVGLCAIGRATNRRFLCYTHPERLILQPELASPPP